MHAKANMAFLPAEAFLIGVVTLTSQYFRKESLFLIFITKLIFGYFKQDFPGQLILLLLLGCNPCYPSQLNP